MILYNRGVKNEKKTINLSDFRDEIEDATSIMPVEGGGYIIQNF